MVIMVCDQSLSLRFAIATGQAGRLIPLECELDFLPHLLTEFGLDGIEFRLVGNGRTGRGLEERFAVRSALSGKWDWDKEADGWFPLDEPLPTFLPGEAVATAVVLSFRSVLFGCIEIVVEAGDKSLTMWLDDVNIIRPSLWSGLSRFWRRVVSPTLPWRMVTAAF